MSKGLTLKQLDTVGPALFGSRWKADAAKLLGVSYAGLARWYSVGAIPDEDGAYLKLVRSEVDKRASVLEALVKRWDGAK